MSLDSNSAVHRELCSLLALTLVEGLLDTGVGLRSFDAPSRGFRGGTHVGTLSSLLRRSLFSATFLLERISMDCHAIKGADLNSFFGEAWGSVRIGSQKEGLARLDEMAGVERFAHS